MYQKRDIYLYFFLLTNGEVEVGFRYILYINILKNESVWFDFLLNFVILQEYTKYFVKLLNLIDNSCNSSCVF